MVHYKIVIGNRNYSSWSMRVWLFVKLTASEEDGDTIQVTRIPLYQGNYKDKIMEYSPAGRVPVLIVSEMIKDKIQPPPITLWDSLAIMEFVASHSPRTIGWPKDPALEATARSIACEFHSGFLNIRDELPQNLKRTPPTAPAKISDACQEQIARVVQIWTQCYEDPKNPAGPWLFGEQITIADIMYIPVALRFHVYGIAISSASAKRFMKATLDHPLVQEWIEDSKAETEVLEFIDNLIPASDSPLVL